MPVTIRGSGQVPVQVVSTTKTDTFITSSTTYVDVTGLSVSITPSSASSKILIMADCYGNGTNGVSQIYLQLTRNGTAIGNGGSTGSQYPCIARSYYGDPNVLAGAVSFNFIDTPSTTSACTYQIQIRTQGAGSVFINRTQNDGNSPDGARPSSTITVMELSQ